MHIMHVMHFWSGAHNEGVSRSLLLKRVTHQQEKKMTHTYNLIEAKISM